MQVKQLKIKQIGIFKVTGEGGIFLRFYAIINN